MKKTKAWEYREKILFADSAEEFAAAAKSALDEITDASLAASVALDLVSYLKEWKLRAYVKAGTLTEEKIEETANAFFELTKSWAEKKRIRKRSKSARRSKEAR